MSKNAKILVLVLSLVLIIGAACALVASADGATPAIVGKNILYTDKTAIQIAVDPATVDADNLSLVVTGANGIQTYEKYEVSTDEDVAGAYVFTVEGIPASAISDVFTFVVKSGDSESEPFTYSVAEYFYERLYSDGIVNATEGKNAARKTFYETYLANGAAAQELFRNYDENGNYVGGTTLVTNYNVLAIEKGTLANGKEIILSTDDITSTVTANAVLLADKTFTGKWTVTTYGDTTTTETVANGAEVTSNGIVSVTPVYTDATGEYYLSDAKGTRIDYDADGTALPGGDASGLLSITDGYLYFERGTQEAAEKYIQFAMPAVDTSAFSSVCKIVEFDIAYGNFWYNWPVFIRFSNNDRIYFRNNMGAPNTFNKMEGTDTSTSVGQSVGKFFNIRIEMYDVTTDGTDVTVAKLYINNEYVKDITASSKVTVGRLIIGMTSGARNAGGDPYLKIDNIYLGTVDKAFVAGDPKAAE